MNVIENIFRFNELIEVAADLLHRGEFPVLDLAGARLVPRQVDVHNHDALFDLLEGVVADEFLEWENRGAVYLTRNVGVTHCQTEGRPVGFHPEIHLIRAVFQSQILPSSISCLTVLSANPCSVWRINIDGPAMQG